jgi:hypothetical protein
LGVLFDLESFEALLLGFSAFVRALFLGSLRFLVALSRFDRKCRRRAETGIPFSEFVLLLILLLLLLLLLKCLSLGCPRFDHFSCTRHSFFVRFGTLGFFA